MKKIITLCLFAFALVINIQTSSAQEKFKVTEERLKVESQELKKLLNLDDAQTSMVWRTMYAKEKAYFDQIKDADPKNPDVIELKKRIDGDFKTKMLDILDDDQFMALTKWLSKQKQ